jgi:hypothetical protein
MQPPREAATIIAIIPEKEPQIKDEAQGILSVNDAGASCLDEEASSGPDMMLLDQMPAPSTVVPRLCGGVKGNTAHLLQSPKILLHIYSAPSNSQLLRQCRWAS